VRRVLIVANARRNSPVKPQWQLLARHLPADRFELHLALLGPTTELPGAATGFCTVTKVVRRVEFDPFAAVELSRLVDRLRPAIIHGWMCESPLLFALVARRSKAKLVLTVDPVRQIGGFALWRRLCKSNIRWVALSATSADDLRKRGLSNAEQVPPAVDFPVAAGKSEQLSIAPSDRHLLVTAGDGLPHERMKDVIWGADLLRCVRSDFRLMLCSPARGRRHLDRFINQCEISGVAQTVEADRFDAILPAASAFITASLRPASELLLFAMAAAVPVIATDLPEHRELIRPGETGLLVAPRDRAGLARMSKKLLENRPLAAALSTAASEFVSRAHQESRMVDRYAAIYQD
jgi:glycosyltransferase involved in cell wall biosynthesis